MKKILFAVSICIFLSGCGTFKENCETSKELFKGFLGFSTKEVEEYRKDATIKILNCGYDACYALIEGKLKEAFIPVYSRSRELIAVYYVDLNTTPVGIFFKAIDANHTQVEVSSPSPGARNAVFDALFLEPKSKERRKPA